MMNKSVSFFLCIIAITLLFAGCGNGSPSKSTVTTLASRCISDRVHGTLQPRDIDINIYNKFTQQLNGEIIYCYDFTYAFRLPDGTKKTMIGLYDTPFYYRITIVIRGNSAEVIGFENIL